MSSTEVSAEAIAKAARSSFEASQFIPASERATALEAIARHLATRKHEILFANSEDLKVNRFSMLLWQLINTHSISGSSKRSRGRTNV